MTEPAEADRALRRLALYRNDFERYARDCLRIKTKDGDITPFRLNRAQRFLHDKLEEIRQRTGLVRALVLKGRQAGVSTYIAARF